MNTPSASLLVQLREVGEVVPGTSRAGDHVVVSWSERQIRVVDRTVDDALPWTVGPGELQVVQLSRGAADAADDATLHIELRAPRVHDRRIRFSAVFPRLELDGIAAYDAPGPPLDATAARHLLGAARTLGARLAVDALAGAAPARRPPTDAGALAHAQSISLGEMVLSRGPDGIALTNGRAQTESHRRSRRYSMAIVAITVVGLVVAGTGAARAMIAICALLGIAAVWGSRQLYLRGLRDMVLTIDRSRARVTVRNHQGEIEVPLGDVRAFVSRTAINPFGLGTRLMIERLGGGWVPVFGARQLGAPGDTRALASALNALARDDDMEGALVALEDADFSSDKPVALGFLFATIIAVLLSGIFL